MTFHLTLKAQWYDMIEQGIKKEEYRETKQYWQKRLCSNYGDEMCRRCIAYCERACHYVTSPFNRVCFHFGYTNRTMTFKIEDIHIGKGNPYWGAEEGKQYFVIKLGERL